MLKVTGLVTAAAASKVGIGRAAAADSTAGYGDGGYGASGYGTVEQETSLGVTTDEATTIETTSATLNGTVTDLGGASSVDVAFEYRPVGGTWSTTVSQTVTSATTFSQSISSLTSGTDYEVRATGLASSGETATGSTVTFTTAQETTDSPPVVDRFNVSEAGRNDPHAEITVVWDVSDVDGDLDSVSIVVRDESGTALRSTSWSFNGTGSAADTDEYWFKKGGGVDYTVEMTVTDQAGNTVTQQATVPS